MLTRERTRRYRRHHEYKADLTRDRAELPPLPVDHPADRKLPVPAGSSSGPPPANGVSLHRVTIDGGAGCNR